MVGGENVMARKNNNRPNTQKPVKEVKEEVVEATVEEATVEEAEVEETPVEEPVEEVKEEAPVVHFAKVVGVKAGLRFRGRPSTDSEVLDILKLGQDNLKVLEEGKEWTKVKVKATIGYVMTKFIEVE